MAFWKLANRFLFGGGESLRRGKLERTAHTLRKGICALVYIRLNATAALAKGEVLPVVAQQRLLLSLYRWLLRISIEYRSEFSGCRFGVTSIVISIEL